MLQDEITSPLGTQIFDFCESELFPETLQNSEAASSSNCYYEEHTSYPTPLSITPPASAGAGAGPTSPPPAAGGRNTNLAILMDDQTVDDISASIDFTLSPSFSIPHDQQQYNNNQEPFAINNQIQLLGDAVAAPEGSLYAPHIYNPDQQQAMAAPPPPPFPTKEEGLQPPYNAQMRDPMMGPYLPSSNATAPFSFDSSWLFFTGGSNMGMGNDHQELESQGDNGGFFLPDSLARVLNCSNGDLQVHDDAMHACV